MSIAFRNAPSGCRKLLKSDLPAIAKELLALRGSSGEPLIWVI